jgi:hypothetical protein
MGTGKTGVHPLLEPFRRMACDTLDGYGFVFHGRIARAGLQKKRGRTNVTKGTDRVSGELKKAA